MAGGPETEIRPLDPSSEEAGTLLRQSDDHLLGLYPPSSTHLDDAKQLACTNVTFVGAWIGESIAGCGAAKIMDDDGRYGEIKRLFVAQEHRGKGLARAIMQHLEAHLMSAGVDVARLETGIRQPAALSLYRMLGYVERGRFGRYRHDPLSVFMEKRLG